MIMLFSKNKDIDNYTFDLRKLSGDTTISDVLDLFKKKPNKKVTYLQPTIHRNDYKNKFLTFSSNGDILDKIQAKGICLTESELTQGIVFPQDFLNKKNQKRLGSNFIKGQGIFGLSNRELQSLHLSKNEMTLIKPYYTTDQIHRYYTDNKNVLWIIYTDSSFKKSDNMKKYPNLKKHLDKFTNIITSDNKPYGLHRARKKHFFKSEKVLVQRKCVGKPSFSYSDFDCFVSATFYVIQTNRFDHKYLTGLLNSKLIVFWLKNKGKMQGNNYQIDKEPLLQIPIYNPTKTEQKPIITLVNKIISAKKKNPTADLATLEQQINTLVYKLYNITSYEQKIIEQSVSI
jgi:adenine-specific DNA-methyltransferase